MIWQDGIKLINKALEKRNEQRNWELYCAIYPDFDKKTYITFEKFCGKTTQKESKITKKKLTNEEIIEKAEQARRLIEMQQRDKVEGR